MGEAGACWTTPSVAVAISGSFHLVLHGRRNDLGLRGETPESGGDWSFSTLSIQGRTSFAAVGTAGLGGRTPVKNRLKVAAAGAGRIRASVLGTGVVEGVQGAHRILRFALRDDMTETPPVPALSVAVEGVCPLDRGGPTV